MLRGSYNGQAGDRFPRTPHMDAAIAEGVRLTNLYVQPMCSPTRGAVMTGRSVMQRARCCGALFEMPERE